MTWIISFPVRTAAGAHPAPPDRRAGCRSAGWMLRGACRSEDRELFFPIAAAGAPLSSRWARWLSPAAGVVITGAWLERPGVAARRGASAMPRSHRATVWAGAPRAAGAADILWLPLPRALSRAPYLERNALMSCFLVMV